MPYLLLKVRIMTLETHQFPVEFNIFHVTYLIVSHILLYVDPFRSIKGIHQMIKLRFYVFCYLLLRVAARGSFERLLDLF